MLANNQRIIIWDWNGTLLNDMDICVRAMNKLLVERNLPVLTSERYREVFTFPVKTYYSKIGFDFSTEAFEIPAIEFIENYQHLLPESELFPEVKNVLEQLNAEGFRQFVLSAMEEKSLFDSIKRLGIYSYFDAIAGIGDHYAHSKVERGIELFTKHNLDIHQAVLIGDTIHDHEVAGELGCRSILVANGHQSAERLKKTHSLVVSSLTDVPNQLKKM